MFKMLVCVIEMKQRQLPSLFELGNRVATWKKDLKSCLRWSRLSLSRLLEESLRFLEIPSKQWKSVVKRYSGLFKDYQEFMFQILWVEYNDNTRESQTGPVCVQRKRKDKRN